MGVSLYQGTSFGGVPMSRSIIWGGSLCPGGSSGGLSLCPGTSFDDVPMPRSMIWGVPVSTRVFWGVVPVPRDIIWGCPVPRSIIWGCPRVQEHHLGASLSPGASIQGCPCPQEHHSVSLSHEGHPGVSLSPGGSPGLSPCPGAGWARGDVTWGGGLAPPLLCPQELSGFTLDQVAFEDGKGKCPYDPTKGHTGLIVGRWHRGAPPAPPAASGGAHPAPNPPLQTVSCTRPPSTTSWARSPSSSATWARTTP